MTQTIIDPDGPARQKTTEEKAAEVDLAVRARKLKFLSENEKAVAEANMLTRWIPPDGRDG